MVSVSFAKGELDGAGYGTNGHLITVVGFTKDGDEQNANPVSGGTYEDLIWVKTIDGDGVETPNPIARNPNFRNTSSRYVPAYGRIGVRLTF